MKIAPITLEGKVVLITGASLGMGQAYALACAQYGADVATFAIDSLDGTKELVKKETGKDILTLNGNMLNLPDIKQAVDQTIEHFGKLDVLVNNAGIVLIKKLTETTEAEYDRVMGVNLKGVFFASKYAAEHMIPRKSGVIINIGSELAHTGAANYTAYSATKGGVYILSQALAIELGPHNIRVVTLSPGPTMTRMCKPLMENPETRQRLLDKVVLGRINEPEDLAPTLVLLASDAASQVTGTNWSVDAGCLAK